MFGKNELKNRLAITEHSVECPVNGCKRIVDRQRHTFQRDTRFMCPDHQIYISPTTFEYGSVRENLLWQNDVDLDLLEEVKKAKRECRMARDNSEDALT